MVAGSGAPRADEERRTFVILDARWSAPLRDEKARRRCYTGTGGVNSLSKGLLHPLRRGVPQVQESISWETVGITRQQSLQQGKLFTKYADNQPGVLRNRVSTEIR